MNSQGYHDMLLYGNSILKEIKGLLNMNMLWTLWEIFVCFAEESLFFYLLNSHLTHKYKKCYTYLGLLIPIFLVSILSLVQAVNPVKLVLVLLVNMIYVIFFFKDNITKKILFGCGLSIIACIADSLTFFVINSTTNMTIKDALLPTETRFIMMIIYLLICLILYFTLAHYKGKKVQLPLGYRAAIVFILLIGTITSDSMIDILITISYSPYTEYSTKIILTSISYLISLLFMVFLFERMGELYAKNLTLMLEVKQKQLEAAHIKEIEKSMSTLRGWKHDSQNQLKTMQALVSSQKYDELQAFMESISSKYQKIQFLVSTGRTSIDAMISHKLLFAKKNQIQIDYEIFFPKQMPFHEPNICMLLGNLFDNAIEACLKIPDYQKRKIELFIKPNREMLHISMTNSSICDYKFNTAGSLVTSKENLHSKHGYGCKRIKEISEEENGFCIFAPEYEEFKANIFLPMS